MIFISSPYSSKEEYVEEARYQQTLKYCATLVRQGLFPFSPIVHFHPMHVYCTLPGDAEFWQAYNVDAMKACSEFIVLLLPGWEASKGVAMEIAWWTENKPGTFITYVSPAK